MTHELWTQAVLALRRVQTALLASAPSQADWEAAFDGVTAALDRIEEAARRPRPEPHPDGETYEPPLDRRRLSGQALRIFELMRDGVWRTCEEIGAVTSDPQASIQARLRDLRKQEFGGYLVPSRRRGDPRLGIWEWQLLSPSGLVLTEAEGRGE